MCRAYVISVLRQEFQAPFGITLETHDACLNSLVAQVAAVLSGSPAAPAAAAPAAAAPAPAPQEAPAESLAADTHFEVSMNFEGSVGKYLAVSHVVTRPLLA